MDVHRGAGSLSVQLQLSLYSAGMADGGAQITQQLNSTATS